MPELRIRAFKAEELQLKVNSHQHEINQERRLLRKIRDRFVMNTIHKVDFLLIRSNIDVSFFPTKP